MPFKPPDNPKCPKCGKSVYAAEERLAAGKKWHKMCLKCGVCNKMLDSTTTAEHEGLVYCKGCHGKKFGPKGYGFGGGSGALSTETGAQHGVHEGEMASRPQEAHIGPSVPPSEGGCPRCGQRVYEAEKATSANLNFHKKCFSCKSCNKKLDSTTVCDNDGEIYDKACYAKLFGPHGKI